MAVGQLMRTTLAGLLVSTALTSCSGSGEDSGQAATSSSGSGSVSGASGQTPARGSPGSRGTAGPTGSSGPVLPAGNGSLTAQVLARLGAPYLTDSQVPTAARGTWKGSQVAAIAQGEDVTLVIKESQGWKIVGGWWPSKGLPGPYLGGRRHVLALGSDARQGQDIQRSRADTIQLIGVDGQGGGGILGMPRDSYVRLPSGRQGKINGAMPAGGPTAMVSAVSSTTGIPIQGYLLSDFVGFQRAVHAIGGITVTLDRPVKDIPAGTRNLGGKQALTLARERKTLPRGDFDRSANQGLLLMSGMIKLRGEGPQRLPALMTAISPHVSTDLTPAQVITLLASAYQVNPTRVGRLVADGQPVMIGGASVVQLTGKASSQLASFRDGNL